jgi:hypothetical protein
MGAEYIKSKIREEELKCRKVISSETKKIKGFYNRYMGLYDDHVKCIPNFVSSDSIIDELLENKFSDIDFQEYETAKHLKKYLALNSNHLNGQNQKKADEFIQVLNDYILRVDHRIEMLISTFERLCAERHGNNSLFGRYWSDGKDSAKIEINLLTCYFFALRYNLKLESFVISTFAHELAHLFNHLGKDKDHLIWTKFDQVDKQIIEGLAQYYAHEYIKEFGILEEFEKENQLTNGEGEYLFNDIYREYKSYINYSREHVYSALIFARRNRVKHCRDFNELLDKFSSELPV